MSYLCWPLSDVSVATPMSLLKFQSMKGGDFSFELVKVCFITCVSWQTKTTKYKRKCSI